MSLSEAKRFLLDTGYTPLISRGRSDPTERYWGNPQTGIVMEIHPWGERVLLSYWRGSFKNLFILFYDDLSRSLRGEQWAVTTAEGSK